MNGNPRTHTALHLLPPCHALSLGQGIRGTSGRALDALSPLACAPAAGRAASLLQGLAQQALMSPAKQQGISTGHWECPYDEDKLLRFYALSITQCCSKRPALRQCPAQYKAQSNARRPGLSEGGLRCQAASLSVLDDLPPCKYAAYRGCWSVAGKSLGHECHLCLLLFRGKLDGAGQAQGFEQRHNLPGHVKLPPIKAMACAELECMMVVVPTFPKGKHSNPPIVPAEISCVVRLHVHTSTSSLAKNSAKIARYAQLTGILIITAAASTGGR